MVRVMMTADRDASLIPPITFQQWFDIHQNLASCMAMRDSCLVRSYLAEDGKRSLCEYEGPYGDAIRESFRESRTPFGVLWKRVLPSQSDRSLKGAIANPIVLELDTSVFTSAEEWKSHKIDIQDFLKDEGIADIEELISADQTKEVWILGAENLEITQHLQQELGVAVQGVWRSQLLIPPPNFA